MRTVAIIQARMGSTRLPGKIMMDLAGEPLLQRVVERAMCARLLDQVAVATTDRPSDNAVAQFCVNLNVACFRGSQDDVLDRYYRAAQHVQADVVVRLTADCPLLDPHVIDQVIHTFHSGGYDYVSNTLELTFPDGLDTEVFRREVLDRAWREAQLQSEREHVTPYIWKHPDLFKLGVVRNAENFSGLRWTVDEPADLMFAREIYARLGTAAFGMSDVLAYLRLRPELKDINAGFGRNEGYQKSLREDSSISKDGK